MDENSILQRNEAIAAGEKALRSLRTAENELDKAKSWGVLDLFSNGMLSGFVKRSKMRNAREYLREAKADLAAFSRELADVNQACSIHIETEDFLSFADWFFDGFVVDWMMQERINRAREQVRDAILQLESTLRRLRNL